MKDGCYKKLNYVTSVNGKTGDVIIEPGEGTVPEAPIDGKQYARQNAEWTVVETDTSELEEKIEEIEAELSEHDTRISTNATNIDTLMDEVFPISFSATGGGNYEIGRSINGSSTFTVKKKGEAVTGMTITATSGTVDGYKWSESNITTDKDVTFTLEGTTKTAKISFKFYYYRYFGETSAVIESNEAAETYIKSITRNADNRQLSSSINKSSTSLGKNKYYVFAVPNTDDEKTVKWTVNHDKTGGEIGYRVSGSITLPLIYTTSTSINYDYVVVPASSIDWSFTITGELVDKE